jgi:hypothetical protein
MMLLALDCAGQNDDFTFVFLLIYFMLCHAIYQLIGDTGYWPVFDH